MQYTVGGGYDASPANQLMHNFKMKMEYKGLPRFKYKGIALNEVASMYNQQLPNIIDFVNTTLVPVPPSLCKADPNYDDRLIRLLELINAPNKDVRELLYLDQNIPTAHLHNNRNVNDIMQHLIVNHQLINNVRNTICLFDDTVVTGSHFAACRNELANAIPGKTMMGVFIARAIH
jgi:predicted amidophosphoribosyltransferase